MIVFKDWEIRTAGTVIARQYDNLSRRLVVAGNIPEGWDWAMLVECQGNHDIIPLHEAEDGCSTCISAVLTEDNLSLEGTYLMQLRAISKEDGITKRHTNIVSTVIPKSLVGYGEWPSVPTEFSEIERNALAAAKQALEQTGLAKGYADNSALSATNAKASETSAKLSEESSLQNATRSETAAGRAEDAQKAAEDAAKRAEESGVALPAGGLTGQVLKKQSDADGDAVWDWIATPDDAVTDAYETGLIDPVADGDNAVFTDENGNVFIF